MQRIYRCENINNVKKKALLYIEERRDRVTTTQYNRIKKSAKISLPKANKLRIITGGLILGTSLMLIHEAIDTRAKVTGNNLHMLRIQETWDDDTGDYLYYGSYDGIPIPYRILDYESGSLLLDCDVGLYPLPYNIEETLANDWKDSHIYKNINGAGYLEDEAILSQPQRNAIQSSQQNGATYTRNRRDGTALTYHDTQANGKVFALNGKQLHQYYPQEEDRVKANISNAKESVYWWIASKGESENEPYGIGIDYQGVEGYMSETSAAAYVSPSFYLDTQSILYIWPSDEKKSYLQSVGWTEENNHWKPTLIAGTGFQAERTLGTSDWDKGGNKATFRILDRGESDTGVSYNQVSAILYDGEMNMLAYGKVAHAHIEEVSVTIPDEAIDQDITLSLFMEDTGGNTDYASNVVTLELGKQGIVESPEEELESQQEDTTVEPEKAPIVVTPGNVQTTAPQEDATSDTSPPEVMGLSYNKLTGMGEDVVTVSGVIDSATGLFVTTDGKVTTQTIETIQYIDNSYTSYTEEEIYTEVEVDPTNLEDEELARSRYLFLILLNALTIQRIWWNIRVRGQVKRQQNGLIELSKYYKDENE